MTALLQMSDAQAVAQARLGCGAVLTGSDHCMQSKDKQDWS